MTFTNVKNPRSEFPTSNYKKTKVGKGVTFGANSTIINGIKIGDYSFIGAGAVVTKNVKKIRLSDNCIKQPYNITEPQPQLFVTPDFAHLSYVLESLANKMALRRGGLSGVQKLIESNALGTIELSTGLQISGVFTNVIAGEFNQTRKWKNKR